MEKSNKITGRFEIDIGAERDLKAVISNSCIDGYLTEKIKELMALVDQEGQHIIVDIVGTYVYRLKRKKYGNKYIDNNLRWILNRAEMLKFNRTGIQPTIITKDGKTWLPIIKKKKHHDEPKDFRPFGVEW